MIRTYPCCRGLLLAGVCACVAGCISTDIPQSVRGVLVLPEDLRAYGINAPSSPAYEVASSTFLPGGTGSASYTYTYRGDSLNHGLSLQEEVSVSMLESSAMRTYALGRRTYRATLRLMAGMDLVDTVLGTYGDESSYAFIVKDSVRVGVLFHCRAGTRVLTLMMTGAYFSTSEAWSELVGPKLEALRTCKLQGPA